MMKAVEHFEKPGIDYVTILLPVMFWVIVIFEILMRS